MDLALSLCRIAELTRIRLDHPHHSDRQPESLLQAFLCLTDMASRHQENKIGDEFTEIHQMSAQRQH